MYFFGGIVLQRIFHWREKGLQTMREIIFYHKQLELINEVQPKISMIENVPGIVNAKSIVSIYT
jgi:DNA (cytosine-5)-methyltransferase 1